MFKQKSTLGIDIGAGGIKLVELRQEKKRPVLFTYGYTVDDQDVHSLSLQQKDNVLPKSLDQQQSAKNQVNKKVAPNNDTAKIKEYSEKIKTLCKISKTTSKSAVVSLPVSSVFHAVVTLPLVKKEEELLRMLKAEIKKFVSGSLDSMSIDYQILGEDSKQKTQRVLVNAVPSDLIIFYSKIFQQAGLTLEALEPESTAITRSLIGRDNSVTMAIDIGAQRTNFFIIDQSIPITHQSVESGGDKIDTILEHTLGLEPSLIEPAKYELFNFWSIGNKSNLLDMDKFMNLFVPIVDPIMKKIEISFEMYFRQESNQNKKPEKIILTGGTALMPFLSQYISNRFNLKCYIGDPWARVVYQQGLKPELHNIATRMSVAIGLALKGMV